MWWMHVVEGGRNTPEGRKAAWRSANSHLTLPTQARHGIPNHEAIAAAKAGVMGE